MDYATILKDVGLSDKEARVYLALLKFDSSTPSAIARQAELKRPTTYVILQQLQAKGMVSHHTNDNQTIYQALSPQLLLEDRHNKYLKLKAALPELALLNDRLISTPQMTIFEGKEGLVKIMEDTLTTSTELLCWCEVDLATNTVLADYFPLYLAKKIKRDIWLRGIFSYNKPGLRHKKTGAKELREVYLIPKNKFPLKNEINIYDDKISIVSHEDQVGVIIQNQNMADTQRSIFSFCFDYAKILEKEILTPEDNAYLES